jgi:precorrin-3B synthase
MNAPINAPVRRGACPGLSAPMATGDGLLARLTPAGSTISLSAFAGLCAAARRHGNGIIEITSRGSIQVRGLNAASAAGFAAEVSALDIPASDGIPVMTDPLSGLDCDSVLDAEALVADLRQALAGASSAQRLSAKLSIAVDGGGSLHLDDLPADIRLRATYAGGRVRFHVALGGGVSTAISLGSIAPDRAAECVVLLLEALAAVAPQARMRDTIETAGLDAFSSAVAGIIDDIAEPIRRNAADPIGVHSLRSGDLAVGVAPPFGHSEAETLQALIDMAARAGASGLRTAPKRALLLIGVPQDSVHDVVAGVRARGFIVDADDPRRRVIACAGAPSCSSGQIPARALAPAIAHAMRTSDVPRVIHVSGCIKGCAHPAAAPMTIVGRNGACEIFRGDQRVDCVTVDALPGRLGELIRQGAQS